MNTERNEPNLLRYPDPDTLARAAATWIGERAREAIEDHGTFRIALSGGTTPKRTYERLAEDPSSVDWTRTQVFFSDERYVPADSPESNYRMAREALLDRVPIPERFVHRVATEDVTPAEAAALYEEGIRRIFQVALADIPRFDLILLGLGPDGHTASLFPGSDALSVTDVLVAPNYVQTMDSWRITFTYPLINAAQCVAFLTEGESKAERVGQVLRGESNLPASRVHPSGQLVWLLDDAAAAQVRPAQSGA